MTDSTIDRITGLESDPEKMGVRDVLGWITRAGSVRVGLATAYIVKPAIMQRARQLVAEWERADAAETCRHTDGGQCPYRAMGNGYCFAHQTEAATEPTEPGLVGR